MKCMCAQTRPRFILSSERVRIFVLMVTRVAYAVVALLHFCYVNVSFFLGIAAIAVSVVCDVVVVFDAVLVFNVTVVKLSLSFHLSSLSYSHYCHPYTGTNCEANLSY